VIEKKTFAIAEVKSAPSDNANGEFEIIMSTDSLDRDGESILKGAFEPLPDSVPVHAFHDFHDPVGRAVPSYDDDGRLVGHGFFASTQRAQEIRQLVADGVIGHSSVGFMAAERKAPGEGEDGPIQIEGAELLEVSFVSVPSNRDAAVLMVKGLDEKKPTPLDVFGKSGARNSSKDSDRLQTIHDLAVENGAKCAHTDEATHDSATDAPATAAEDAAKSPASTNVVALARLRAEAALLMADIG